jgi:hypothetical protein
MQLGQRGATTWEPPRPTVRHTGMRTGLGRWLVPLGAALAVLVVVAVVVWQQGPGGSEDAAPAGSGQPSDRASVAPGSPAPDLPDGDLTPAPGPDLPPGPDTQVIDSYFAYDETRLALNYTTGVPECYGKVGEPIVEETADAVTVTLPKLPPEQKGDVACIDIALSKSVDISLDAPLRDREVRDGARGGAEVSPGSSPGNPSQAN